MQRWVRSILLVAAMMGIALFFLHRISAPDHESVEKEVKYLKEASFKIDASEILKEKTDKADLEKVDEFDKGAAEKAHEIDEVAEEVDVVGKAVNNYEVEKAVKADEVHKVVEKAVDNDVAVKAVEKDEVDKDEAERTGKSRVKIQQPRNSITVSSEQSANSANNGNVTERQRRIVEMFKHAWRGYTKYAWGKDELLPLTKTGTLSYGLGLTIIDSLDTMWLMGLKKEFNDSRQWVEENLDIRGNHRTVSVFETNIRVLGGLLAAYHLSNDQIFLQKAVELGDRLLIAFQTETGIPYGSVRLDQDTPIKTSDVACIAELGSLQLEFRDLSHSTGNNKYRRAADKALEVVQSHITSGIATQEVFIRNGVPKGTELTVGARTDSYYEYLLKQWIQSGKHEEKFRGWYSKSADQIISKFVKYSQPSHMAFLAKLQTQDGVHFSPIMDHLSCFLPGLLALGYLHGFPKSHLNIAKNLTNTCYQLYHQSNSGLSPEIAHFSIHSGQQSDIHFSNRANILRPETVESLFVLYRVTKDPIYREWGWEIAQAFEKHSRVENGGYTTLADVQNPNPHKNNKMESFFLAETLKYLFLLFSDDSVLPLDQWVFNTEAHPLPVWISVFDN